MSPQAKREYEPASATRMTKASRHGGSMYMPSPISANQRATARASESQPPRQDARSVTILRAVELARVGSVQPAARPLHLLFTG